MLIISDCFEHVYDQINIWTTSLNILMPVAIEYPIIHVHYYRQHIHRVLKTVNYYPSTHTPCTMVMVQANNLQNTSRVAVLVIRAPLKHWNTVPCWVRFTGPKVNTRCMLMSWNGRGTGAPFTSMTMFTGPRGPQLISTLSPSMAVMVGEGLRSSAAKVQSN